MERTREEVLADPVTASREISTALAAAAGAPPQVPDVPDDTVRLPGGLVRDGSVIRSAVVRELNGADEEALSRALKGSVFRFMDILIEHGTASVGSLPASRDVLKSLLIGDRDELTLAIRIATYGDEMSIEQWTCPECGAQTDISFSLTEDVPRKTLDDPARETVFEVGLRKGAKAVVRLPNGADQDALFEDESWTTAQRNTVLISRCVQSYTDPAGQTFSMIAFPSKSRELSIPDRQAIIAEIARRQPGPRYNEIKFQHDECQNEVILALGVTDLFRDLISFL